MAIGQPKLPREPQGMLSTYKNKSETKYTSKFALYGCIKKVDVESKFWSVFKIIRKTNC